MPSRLDNGYAPGTTQPTKVRILCARCTKTVAKPGDTCARCLNRNRDIIPEVTGPRKRGRPKGSKNKPKASALPSSAPDATQWSELHRLGVMVAMMTDLQTMWKDPGLTHRDRVPLSRQVGNLAEQIQSERQRIAAENPEPVLPVDQAELVAEVCGGFMVLPRSMLDVIAARLEVIRNEK